MKYKDYQPTVFDTKGLGLPDRQNWVVAPVTRTRDSVALGQSNFETALSILGGESDTVEVHRFGHWGPGWFEIILAHPDHEDTLTEIGSSLENYPVLDYIDLSSREFDEQIEAWDNVYRSEFIDLLEDKYEIDDLDDHIPEKDDVDMLFHILSYRSSVEWENTNEGACIDLDRLVLPDNLKDCKEIIDRQELEYQGQGRLF